MDILRRKVILVTGASSGIGRETAVALAGQGAQLVVFARRRGLLEKTAQDVSERGGQALVVIGDVTKREDLERAVMGCVERFGRLDVLVNNAGVGLFAAVEESSEQDLDRIMAVNFKGVVNGVQAALPVMRRQGHGHIINVASTAGRRGSPYVGAYCASKFAVVGLTESLRTELLGSGIRVSLVCPGATRTSFFDVAIRRRDRHEGLVGPVESAEDVARRIVRLIRHPKAENVAQPIRRKLFFILNILAPSLVDRLLARILKVDPREGASVSCRRRNTSGLLC